MWSNWSILHGIFIFLVIFSSFQIKIRRWFAFLGRYLVGWLHHDRNGYGKTSVRWGSYSFYRRVIAIRSLAVIDVYLFIWHFFALSLWRIFAFYRAFSWTVLRRLFLKSDSIRCIPKYQQLCRKLLGSFYSGELCSTVIELLRDCSWCNTWCSLFLCNVLEPMQCPWTGQSGWVSWWMAFCTRTLGFRI